MIARWPTFLSSVVVVLLSGCGTGSPPPAAEPVGPVGQHGDAGFEAEVEIDAGEPVAEPTAVETPLPQPTPEVPDAAVEPIAAMPKPEPPELKFMKGRGRCKKQLDCLPDDCCAPGTCVSKKFAPVCKTHHCPDMLGPMDSAVASCACHKGRCGAMYPENFF